VTTWRADTDFGNIAEGTVLTIHTRRIVGVDPPPMKAGDAFYIFNVRSECTRGRILNASAASITIELPTLGLIATPKNENDHQFGEVGTGAIASQVWIVRQTYSPPAR
jgi:hypothetical protein